MLGLCLDYFKVKVRIMVRVMFRVKVRVMVRVNEIIMLLKI